MLHESLNVFKSLSDKSRLLIINALLEKPSYVELIAKRLDLSPSTVSFHLKKLEEAGLVTGVKEQYYMTYHVNEVVLDKSLKQLVNVQLDDKKIQEDREREHREKIINSFFIYGRLKSLPVQQKKKRVILEEIAKVFEEDLIYTEKEINIALIEFHDDFCTLRRGLIEEKLFVRENNFYKKVKSED